MGAPKPPDPKQTADEQIRINTDTAETQAKLGMTGQETPWGTLSYVPDANSPSGYRAVQTMSAGNQALYDSLMGGATGLANNISTPITMPDFSGLSPLPTANDYSADRQRVEDALFSRLNPQLTAARTSFEQDLFNRGVRPGTEAYDRAMQNLAQQENDQRTSVLLAGGSEQSRMFADALAGRQQGYNELANQFNMNLAARQEPINEYAALMGSTGVQSPNYVPTPQPGVSGVDYAGLVNQNYQQQLQNRQNTLSGLFNLGGSIVGGLFGLSDARAKEDIERVGETDEGLGVYTYRYKGDPEVRMGVMAQEVARTKPEAVAVRPDGYLGVDYSRIG